MKARLLKGLQAEFIPALFDGTNRSGIHPTGKRVLVMMDEASAQTSGSIHLPQEMVERMSMASESGAIYDMGSEAFSRHSDGSHWTGNKPKIGDRVCVERYAGVLIPGIDGKTYRVMEDSCIAATIDVIASDIGEAA